jgi:hypothetical protein
MELEMGCDIHLVVEKKFDKKWVGLWTSEDDLRMPIDGVFAVHDGSKRPAGNAYWHSHRDRNYKFFALLAGVRGSGPDPKGIPEDASDLARIYIDQDGSDGHSHSWDMLDDFHEKWIAANSEPGEYVASKIKSEANPRFEHMHPLRWRNEEQQEEYRVIYWFDN